MSSRSRRKSSSSMLLNHNRPTVRGLKKCKFCGMYNGHRTKFCKNKSCSQHALGISLQTVVPRSVDSISLISDNEALHFSVKVRDKGPNTYDNRNFVKITDKTIQSDEDSLIIHRIAICYVDICKYDSKTASQLSCRHVKESVNDCQKKASGVSVTEWNFQRYFSQIEKTQKSDLWLFVSGSRNPVVQQLNETLFVVKCLPTDSKELERAKKNLTSTDFFHCELKIDEKTGTPKSGCSCNRIKILMSESNTVMMENDVCYHILLIYAALDGDNFLSEKFKLHLKMAEEKYLFTSDIENDQNIDPNLMNDVMDEVFLMGQNLELSDCQIELLDDFLITDQIELCDSFKLAELLSPELFSTTSNQDEVPSQVEVPLEKMTGAEEMCVDEVSFNIDFESILNSIIERINHNMSFYDESQDNVQEFFFFVHNDFFNCLNDRFSSNPNKKCLPSETIFHNKGSLRGLTTYVYKFYQPTTLQRVFATNSLNIITEKVFLQREKDKYENIETFFNDFGELDLEAALSNLRQIQPVQFKKTINLNWEGAAKNCFKIEWTANVLPVSSHGELKISFKYNNIKVH